jgi:hypothetical protein
VVTNKTSFCLARTEGGHHEGESGPPMTPDQFVALDPTAFKETLERRADELSGLLHTLTTERAILQSELRLLRAGHKSSLEVKSALTARGISV